MVIKTTMPTNATITTIITDELLRKSASALLYQPDKKLMSTATAKSDANGKPIVTLLKNFFLCKRCWLQYAKNFCSSLVSINKKNPGV